MKKNRLILTMVGAALCGSAYAQCLERPCLNEPDMALGRPWQVPAVEAFEEEAAEAPVTEATGEYKTYMRNCQYVERYFVYYTRPRTAVDFAAELYFDNDNSKVYFKNPLTGYVSDTYIVGDLADNKITFKFPQPIHVVEGEDANTTYYVGMAEYYEYEDKGTTYYSYCPVTGDENQIVVTINDDGSLSTPPTSNTNGYPHLLMGLVAKDNDGVDSWYAYGDANLDYKPFDYTPNQLPDGVEAEEGWVAVYNGEGHAVKVAFDGDDVYLLNVIPGNAKSCLKGTVDSKKINFPSGQIAAIDGVRWAYLLGCKTEIVQDDLGDLERFYRQDNLTFDYYPDQKKMKSFLTALFNAYLEKNVDIVSRMDKPIVRFQGDEPTYGKPLAPEVSVFSAYDSGAGYGSIKIVIPALDVNDNLLDTSKMTYRLFVDGELFPLEPDEYHNVPETLVDIPYNFQDGYDFMIYGATHYFVYYFQNAETFAVKSKFSPDADHSYESDLVQLNFAEAGISSVEDGASVAVEYYDLQGRRLAAPRQGLVIRRTVNADGSASVSKLMLK